MAFKALLAGAAMQGEELSAGILQLLAPGERVGITAAPAQPGFDRDGQLHRLADGLHDPGRQIRFTNQAAAAAFFGDFFDRAAHIDVDQKGSGVLGALGGFGHGLRPVIKQLHANGAFFCGQFLHLPAAMAHLQAGGIHHLGEQQGIRAPAPHQAAEDSIRNTSQR